MELVAPVPVVMSSTSEDQPTEDVSPQNSNHEEAEPKLEVSPEEMRSIITVIAATGKFWHDWLFLRSILSVQMKQVLAEYPETQRSSLSGETYDELVHRLNEALLNFDEGPPFTLQRVCEILLSPKSTYSNVSKLALALEKNLLVTSTLTRCTEPYPKVPTSPEQQPEEGTVPVPVPPHVDHAPTPLADSEPKSEPNGAETTSEGQPIPGDTDEEMPDVEPESEPKEQNHPNPPDVEMQDMEEKATKEEETAVQEEKVEEVEVVKNDESTVTTVCQSDVDSASVPDGEAVTADKVDPPSGESVVEP